MDPDRIVLDEIADMPPVFWTCELCGLETERISEHLGRAHSMSAEDVVALLDERDRARRFAEQQLLARQQIAEAMKWSGL